MKMTRWWMSPLRAAFVLPGILLAAALTGCSGSAVTGGGTTAVTVTVGGVPSSTAPASASSRGIPRPLGAAIPSTVSAIRFTISGAAIDNIVETVPVAGGAPLTVTLQVPSGPGRTILVEALDDAGIPHFRGTTTIDATGVPLSVTIGMGIDSSNPGLQTWAPVGDAVSPSSTLNRLAMGDGIVVAAGTAREVLSSTDGISWSPRSPGDISGDVSALSFGNHTFLAMTSSGNFSAVPPVWTNRFFAAPGDNVDSWILRGSVVETFGPLADIDFGGGIFVAVGGDSVYRSADNGATWSSGTIPGVSFLADVAYGNGRFVAVDGAGDNVAVSTDGASWSVVPVGLPSPDRLGKVGFGGGLFLLTTSAGDVFTSADGASWLQRTRFADIGGLDTSVSRVAYGGGAFLIVTGSPTQIFFSFDSGGSWVAVDPAGGGGGFSLEDAGYWNGAFIGAGGDFVFPAYGHVYRSGDL